ncbi:MAG: hypothetical protein QM493_04870 [Sulfurovum sp.]
MYNNKEKLFRLQIIQDNISAYYSLPLRIMRSNALDIAYNLLDKNLSFVIKNNITSKDNFAYFIIDFIGKLPDMYSSLSNEDIENIRDILEDFAKEDVKKISKDIFLTYGSFHPKLYRKLKKEDIFFAFAILNAIYISVKHSENKINDININSNFSFNTTKFIDNIVIIGPYCQNNSFDIFIKNIISIFDLDMHSFELEMLHEDKSNSMINGELKQIQDIFSNHIHKVLAIKSDFVLSQSDIKKISILMVYISINDKNKASIPMASDDRYMIEYIDKKYLMKDKLHISSNKDIEKIEEIIKKHYYFFQLEAFNSIGENLYNKFIPFDSHRNDNPNQEEFKNSILKALRRLVYADAVIFYNYIEHDEKFEFLESDKLDDKEKQEVKNALETINTNSEIKKNSLTYRIVTDYYKDDKVGLLENSVDSSFMIQPFSDKYINSVLSIPLIYDHKIRGVLHFFSYRKNAFDNQNKNFLFLFSDFLTHLMVESIFLQRQSDIVQILNKYNFKSHRKSKDFNTISSYIADVFTADGVMIFLKSRDIKDDACRRDYIHLVDSIGFDIDEDFAIHKEDSLLGRRKDDIVIVSDIEKIDAEDMVHYDTFIEKNIKSFMAIKINGENGELEGAIVVVDREKRKYNALSRKMLRILSEEIRLLNILNMQTYRNESAREEAIHELKQTFIHLQNQINKLDRRLKSDMIVFLDNIFKNNIFKNINDIKLFSRQSISFIHNFFRGTEEGRDDYELIIEQHINKIDKYIGDNNSVYESIRDACMRVNSATNIKINMRIQSSIKVKLPDEVMHYFLSNIINNAVKYSKQNQTINITYAKDSRFLSVYFDNIGVRILEDEKDRIFSKGVRGRSVLADDDNEKWHELESENRGLGCYYVKQLATKSRWKGNFLFEEIEKVDKIYSKNRFILKFPLNIIQGV